MSLRYWIVTWWHECDYPSRGAHVSRIVAAHDEEEARHVAGAPRTVVTDLDGLPAGETWDRSAGIECREFALPDLTRKRKPFALT